MPSNHAQMQRFGTYLHAHVHMHTFSPTCEMDVHGGAEYFLADPAAAQHACDCLHYVRMQGEETPAVPTQDVQDEDESGDCCCIS